MRELVIDAIHLDTRLTAACAVAREAGLLTRERYFNRDSAPLEFKGHQDYLTATDQEVETLIIGRLSALFAEDTFLGEEGGGVPGPRVWVIDPIDGTENFARGIPHFCTSIAYVAEGAIQLGVIYNPMTDELFTAKKGQGAWANGKAMQVSRQTEIGNASIEVGWSNRIPMEDYLILLRRITGTGAGFKRSGSGALGMVYVAAGRLEGYCELHINSWDVLAALLMVEEAGGWCNDFLAGDGLTKGNPILAVTPALKSQLTAAAEFGD